MATIIPIIVCLGLIAIAQWIKIYDKNKKRNKNNY